MKNEEETLDPSDWTEACELAHRMVEDAVRHLEEVRERHFSTRRGSVPNARN